MSPAQEGNIEGSTWLIRTRFSRSVCYGLNSSSLSNISGPLLEDSNPKEFVNIMKENPNLFFALPESTDIGDLDVQRSNSDTAMAKNAAVYPSLSSECLNPLLYTSNSVNTSPEKMSAGHGYRHQRSLSLPSTCGSGRIDEDDGAYSSCGEYSSDGSKTDDASQMDAGRAASWSEYFVKSATGLATEEADDCTIDLSNLLLGNKFASGAYSRLYLGKYNDVPVAVKMLRKPDDDEEISRRLDRQFQAEVNALSRVSHRNVIKVNGPLRC
ncbi:hypothetical protein KP509_01G066500 [Ceratopteris richardii]|uniref:Protein kinase domain-containing protein n=1 Tax=Ceratopteris richardii TaxID=49495 RepID=A0A8T2VDW4_CERRI|nr:hypothetical protein KP509_01G066500 [Ceratopteris richardii]